MSRTRHTCPSGQIGWCARRRRPPRQNAGMSCALPHAEQFLAYLKHYADRKMESISAMLADDIPLHD